mmetsp:Transcript_27289/g.74668  ORF Transcript_27289/g.74668 Transcript_27289/m.74668 type:complete len:200 (+) Transcript_27289:401-1000(+)
MIILMTTMTTPTIFKDEEPPLFPPPWFPFPSGRTFRRAFQGVSDAIPRRSYRWRQTMTTRKTTTTTLRAASSTSARLHRVVCRGHPARDCTSPISNATTTTSTPGAQPIRWPVSRSCSAGAMTISGTAPGPVSAWHWRRAIQKPKTKTTKEPQISWEGDAIPNRRCRCRPFTMTTTPITMPTLRWRGTHFWGAFRKVTD